MLQLYSLEQVIVEISNNFSTNYGELYQKYSGYRLTNHKIKIYFNFDIESAEKYLNESYFKNIEYVKYKDIDSDTLRIFISIISQELNDIIINGFLFKFINKYINNQIFGYSFNQLIELIIPKHFTQIKADNTQIQLTIILKYKLFKYKF